MAASPFTTDTHPLIRHLASVATLSEEEKHALLSLPMQVMELRADQDIVREGDRPTRSCLILQGWACTFKMTGDGKRQIMGFHIAGNIPDLQSLHLTVLDSSLGTMSPCRVAFIQHEALHALCEQHYGIARALWRVTLADAAIFREWIMNVGRREAHSQLAHVLCEMLVRTKAVGLARDHTCEMTVTQQELGDATGNSAVHVNRVLQQLRRDGLISLESKTLKALDWEALKAAGDFDPTYLHLKHPERDAA